MSSVRAIIKRGNKFLLVQRSADSTTYVGYWQFVGGKSEGMPLKQALIKEVNEEVGLSVKKATPLITTYNKERGYKTINYLVEADGEVSLQEEEVSSYGWFSKEEMRGLPLTPDTKKVVNKI